MTMESHEVTATITFEATFTVEATSEQSAERKIGRLLDKVDLFEVVEGRSDNFKKASRRHDIVCGPMNDARVDSVAV